MKKIALLVLLLVLGGCANKAEVAKRQAMIDNTTPVCSTDAECKRMWSASQVWVSNNIKWRIQTATDSIIQTLGPNRSEQTATAATVTKEPIPGGGYRIAAKFGCYAMIVCAPATFDAALNFNNYVAAAR
jgi:hypothetical protein